jgi:hypothetical protein
VTSWHKLQVGCLFACAAVVQASDAPDQPPVDPAFLEFLGSWDDGDEQWLGAAIAEAGDEAPGPAADREHAETEDHED